MAFIDLPDFLSGEDDNSDTSDKSGLYNSNYEYSWNSRVRGL
jgi:hypothetical protein